MNEITIDLTKMNFPDSTEALFTDEDLVLKHKNFIFAKNGSGKSTLADFIKEHKSQEYEVHVFKGFESVLGENMKLNAFALAVDAVDNEHQIKQLEEDRAVEEAKRKYSAELLNPEPAGSKENLFAMQARSQKNLEDKVSELNKFYIDSAKHIKNKNNPPIIYPPNYNKNNFKRDISKESLLQEVERSRLELLLKSEATTSVKIDFNNANYEKHVEAVNEIIQSKVTEKVKISRLNTQQKINFAQDGLHIHREDETEICVFCGSDVLPSAIEELESYFSTNEVKELQARIKNGQRQIEREIKKLDDLQIDSISFYPQFIGEVEEETKNIYAQKDELYEFWREIKKSLEEKERNLFSEMDQLKYTLPDGINTSVFNGLVEKNNRFADNLMSEQQEARDKLLYHEIAILLNQKNYDIMLNDKIHAEKQFNKVKEEFDKEGINLSEIVKRIEIIGDKVRSLQPKAERQAIERINNKLHYNVPWELDYFEDEDSGYYHVKQGVRYRGVTELSTGEKNIIAFLYFIEKLEAVQTDSIKRKDKIIIFDDPMNSNDSTMQYLIITELLNLYQGKDRKKFIPDKDFMIVLTHNVHFYLNVQPHGNYKDKNGKTKYDKNNFYRIESRKFKKISTLKDDIQTSYASLWVELKDLYECGHKNSMLNAMRRIIETYIKFNSLGQTDFYKGNAQYLKLFNVNSHSIDDLSAETFAEDTEQMKELFSNIFKDNGAEAHFNSYWCN
ncbi:AAA family ATPase [Listeria booriae]|uniref:AAA family ATPase n=1 Tax=Listeria booriae TaxID=1552123 RepID=UPI00164E88FD|nr:AAA family ATPase [Listeria booriae]MBC6162667.1 AAA family ATPase [Listeria booriae]